MGQLGQLARDIDLYEEKGAQVLAIAVQDETGAELSVDNSGAPFPVLADADHAVTEAYGIYNDFGDGFAAASVFIINPDGQIVWQSIAEEVSYREASSDILAQLP